MLDQAAVYPKNTDALRIAHAHIHIYVDAHMHTRKAERP